MSTAKDVLADGKVLYDYHSLDSGPVSADVIIVAGSHDLRVADRAAELYLIEGAAPLVVCSGGSGKVTGKIWSQPEGALYAERCAQLGVPVSALIVEPLATNTGENFTFSRAILDANGTAARTGIIVSKPYMARRAWATASKQWPLDKWFTRPPRISFDEYPSEDVPLERMLNLMVGDLQRLRVYAAKGFQAPVEIPENVWQAYERLVSAGYDSFVLR